jgi:hypothetical protein
VSALSLPFDTFKDIPIANDKAFTENIICERYKINLAYDAA